ncbi:MAG: hypothetical protein Q9214_005396 [Letrouitia sp. 1 TL-2023]
MTGLGAARGGGFSRQFTAKANGGAESREAVFDKGIEGGEGSDNCGEEDVGDRPGDFGDEDNWREKGSIGQKLRERRDGKCARCDATSQRHSSSTPHPCPLNIGTPTTIDDAERITDLRLIHAMILGRMHLDRIIEEPGNRLALEQVHEKADEKPDDEDTEERIIDYQPRFRGQGGQSPVEEAHGDFDEGHGCEEGDLVYAAELEGMRISKSEKEKEDKGHLSPYGDFLVGTVVDVAACAAIVCPDYDVDEVREREELFPQHHLSILISISHLVHFAIPQQG